MSELIGFLIPIFIWFSYFFSYEVGKQGSFKKALYAIFDVD